MSDQKQGSFCRCVFEMKVHFLDFTIVFAKDETNFAKDENPFAKDENDYLTVSYTHLTLPTNREV